MSRARGLPPPKTRSDPRSLPGWREQRLNKTHVCPPLSCPRITRSAMATLTLFDYFVFSQHVFYLLVVLVCLSVPVQKNDLKESSSKWPTWVDRDVEPYFLTRTHEDTALWSRLCSDI